MKALLAAKQRADPQGWQRFQSQVSTLKLRSTRAQRELDDAINELDSSIAMASLSGISPGAIHSCNTKNYVATYVILLHRLKISWHCKCLHLLPFCCAWACRLV